MDLLPEIAVMSVRGSRQIMEFGALSGLIGGLFLAAGGVRPSFQKTGLLVGGILLVVGFALIIVAWHWGFAIWDPHNP